MNPAIRPAICHSPIKTASVLHDVSLSVESGEMIGILGPNGSGKTTLLKIFSAVLQGQGAVKINDRDIETYGQRDLSRLFAVVAARKPREFSLHGGRNRLNGASQLSQPLRSRRKKRS